jgi:hypothetical protein
MPPAKCKVVFQRGRGAVAAVLMYKGKSLNYLQFPRGYKPSMTEARHAKKALMAGCNELARDQQRHERRVKRGH